MSQQGRRTFLLLVSTGPSADASTGLFSWDLDDGDQGKELSFLVIALAFWGVLEIAERWENGKARSSEVYAGLGVLVMVPSLAGSELFHLAGWETVCFMEDRFLQQKVITPFLGFKLN